MPMLYWSAFHAPLRRQLRFISPTAASKPETCLWFQAYRLHRRSRNLRARFWSVFMRARSALCRFAKNRLLGLKAHRDDDQYIDKAAVAEEVSFSRRLCAKHNWPTIDVTRRSIEETAAAVMRLLSERRRHPMA